MLSNHNLRLVALSLLSTSELQISWLLRCSDMISPPIIEYLCWRTRALEQLDTGYLQE